MEFSQQTKDVSHLLVKSHIWIPLTYQIADNFFTEKMSLEIGLPIIGPQPNPGTSPRKTEKNPSGILIFFIDVRCRILFYSILFISISL